MQIPISEITNIVQMSSIIIKCPNCEYEFDSLFQNFKEIKNIHTNCPKCACSFDIESNLK